MSRRGRRASSAASRGETEEGDESDGGASEPPPPSRKRKRPDPAELCRQIYDAVRCHKKEDGTPLCDSFIRAPKRRQEPQYYEVVSQPIDLLRVQQKLKTDSYDDVDELASDLELLVNNAKAFYPPDSSEHRDAVRLWTLFETTRRSLEAPSDSDANDDDDPLEDYFAAVMNAVADADGRPLHAAFLDLPSKRRYPEYYDVIKQPLDLRAVAARVSAREYASPAAMERDLLLLARNACAFNEPGSQIYRDAKALKRLAQAKRQELERGRPQTPARPAERTRARRPAGGRRATSALSSAAVAAAAAPPSDSEDEPEDAGAPDPDAEPDEAEDGPQWRLLETVKGHRAGVGPPPSEAFLKLPSKRFNPDYYKEIKNPVSLTQIEEKIRRGAYGTLSEVAGDMNVMFENAKRYNAHTSRLYKDAVRLQRLMQRTVHELLDVAQESSDEDAAPRGRGRPRLDGARHALRRRLHALQRHLLEYTCSDGRQPMLLFMEKPSKKLYPDYYTVIERPIDMLTIESNIRNDRYPSLDRMVADFRLMFWNCRRYNEEGSMIYEDADLLERALDERLGETTTGTPCADRKTPSRARAAHERKNASPSGRGLRTLYEAVRDHRDPKGNRQLALAFVRLPAKSEYPDYYELIKNPLDLERTAQRLKANGYASLDDLAADLLLVFDNACKYNEPDSQIYKDALVLRRVCLRTKEALREDERSVPDVAAAVRELLATLFTAVYNHQDEEGRCYSDSMAELPEYDGADAAKTRGVSLDLVKRRLDRGLYRRLDHFQEDLFAVFERARNLSRTDSQVFEDSVEMQLFYVAARDRICGEGAVLSSPALRTSKGDVLAAVELVRQCKMLEEHTADEETDAGSGRACDDDAVPPAGRPPSQTRYRKGDFVYVQPKKGQQEPAVVQIERIWNDADDVPVLYGNVYFRPHETFHVATRRFLERELFKTESYQVTPLDQVVGKCFVMNVKDYFKSRPEGYADRDVFVCESRYSTKSRSFKKIKIWPAAGEGERFVPRAEPLEPKRVMSVFRERVEKHKDELAELELLENVQEKERPNVTVFNPLGSDDENTYYEQYNTICSGLIKTGDYVHVVTDGGKQMIAQIDTIWETKDGKCYFRGPWLIFPADVAGTVNKVFYKQEVMLTDVHDSSPLVGIVGKCSVLHYDDYLKCRPTEIPENDVFVCESFYDEANRTSHKLKSGLRKYEHTEAVTVDEIYWFPRTLGPPPLANGSDTNVLRPSISNMDMDFKSDDVEMLLENSLDESSLQSPATPLSSGCGLNVGVGSGPATPLPNQNSQTTPMNSKKKKDGKKLVTGYILYSSEVRKAITASNPDSTFGEISRLVGNEWRSLPSSTKQSWEEKAAKCNEETAAKCNSSDIIVPPPPPSNANNSLHPDFIFECLWDNCDYQFEDFADCTEHCIGESTGHVQQYYSSNRSSAYQCIWRGCPRMKRTATATVPFPNLARLTRHVRDLHINKSNGRNVPACERSKNFVSSRSKPKSSVIQHRPPSQAGPGQTVSLSQLSPLSRGTPSPAPLTSFNQSGRPMAPEALFVSVPPRPHRIQHSEAYIRYIEGLHSEQKYITPWDKTLVPAPANPSEVFQGNVSKVPVHWFSEELVNSMTSSNEHSNEFIPLHQNSKVVKALWNLRDLMLRDAFTISKNL